jgi:GT2 family glycosyltransferase
MAGGSGEGDEAVTISVVSHGQRALVGSLLSDLARLQPPCVSKLILTLNVPEPAPAELERLPFESLVLRNERPRGFAANHNRAFLRCTTPWFAVLNPDLRLTGDFLSALLRAKRPEDALLSPRVLESDGSVADASRRLLTPRQLLRRALGQREPVHGGEADWFAGMCLLVRADAYAAAGGFDERFYMYLEDADLCLRLKLAGWRIRQVEDATVIHAAQRASRRSPRHLQWHIASLAKHWLSAPFWRYLFARRRAG